MGTLSAVYVKIVNGEGMPVTWEADKKSRPETLGEELAKYALQNNQWAEALVIANERLNDADWRNAQLIDIF